MWLIALVALVGCARGSEQSIDAMPATPVDSAITIDGGTDGTIAAVDAAAGNDAGCWSCGLPSGMFSSTYTLTQSDCTFDFSNGSESKGSADISVVLHGTSPNALEVDVYFVSPTKVCTVPVAADGSWSCFVDYSVSNTSVAGHINGSSMVGSLAHSEQTYDLVCSNLSTS